MTAPNLDALRQIAAETPGARWVDTDIGHGKVRKSAWVPYGPGFEIPLYYEYDGDNPFEWTMAVLVVEGRPRCISFECRSEKGITPTVLHGLPLGRFLRDATLMASRPENEVPRKVRAWKDVEEVRRARAAVAIQHQKRGTYRGRRIDDDLLAEVAGVYRDNIATGKPSKAVAEYFRYTDASARRIVHQARLRGLLGLARPGRAGELPDGAQEKP
jgi:hypothetical protein